MRITRAASVGEGGKGSGRRRWGRVEGVITVVRLLILLVMIVVLQSKKIISTASYSTEAHDARGTVEVQVL